MQNDNAKIKMVFGRIESNSKRVCIQHINASGQEIILHFNLSF